jgi:hypothetical protein
MVKVAGTSVPIANWINTVARRRESRNMREPTFFFAPKVAAIALANKLARMAWAMMARDEHY